MDAWNEPVDWSTDLYPSLPSTSNQTKNSNKKKKRSSLLAITEQDLLRPVKLAKAGHVAVLPSRPKPSKSKSKRAEDRNNAPGKQAEQAEPTLRQAPRAKKGKHEAQHTTAQHSTPQPDDDPSASPPASTALPPKAQHQGQTSPKNRKHSTHQPPSAASPSTQQHTLPVQPNGGDASTGQELSSQSKSVKKKKKKKKSTSSTPAQGDAAAPSSAQQASSHQQAAALAVTPSTMAAGATGLTSSSGEEGTGPAVGPKSDNHGRSERSEGLKEKRKGSKGKGGVAELSVAGPTASTSGQEGVGKLKEGAKKPGLAKGSLDLGLSRGEENLGHAEGAQKLAQKGSRGGSLLEKMKARLAGGAFRHLNELLYTSSGQTAYKEMQADPSMFQQYHQGFQHQTQYWPMQPVQVAIKWLQGKSDKWVVGDFGCGDAQLAKEVAQTVHSLDLVATVPGVIACNMSRTPLATSSLDAAVFCLSLMGTDYGSFLVEAHRVLKTKGWLWVAEVSSRFVGAGGQDYVPAFLKCLGKLGFQLVKQDRTNTHFVIFVLRKSDGGAAATTGEHLKWPSLKACLYKKR